MGERGRGEGEGYIYICKVYYSTSIHEEKGAIENSAMVMINGESQTISAPKEKICTVVTTSEATPTCDTLDVEECLGSWLQVILG